MKRKKISYLFLIIACFIVQTLDAYQLYVQGSIQDMMASKRMHVRIMLDPTEQYIYKDSLRFSIDVPGIELKSWHASINPTQQYSLLFKRNKFVYPESFTAEIIFNAEKQALDQVDEANMYVAALVYGKDGKNKANTVMVSLNQKDGAGVPEEQKQISDSIMTGTGATEMTDDVKKPIVEELGTEFAFFRELFGIWTRLVAPGKQFIGSRAFFLWYLVLLLVFILFVLKRRYRWLRYVIPFQGVWEKELRRFFGFVVGGASFYFLQFLIPMHIVLYALAVFLLITACYYLKKTPYSETFLGKLKALLGFLLAAAILPVLIKGFLSQSSLFLR